MSSVRYVSQVSTKESQAAHTSLNTAAHVAGLVNPPTPAFDAVAAAVSWPLSLGPPVHRAHAVELVGGKATPALPRPHPYPVHTQPHVLTR